MNRVLTLASTPQISPPAYKPPRRQAHQKRLTKPDKPRAYMPHYTVYPSICIKYVKSHQKVFSVANFDNSTKTSPVYPYPYYLQFKHKGDRQKSVVSSRMEFQRYHLEVLDQYMLNCEKKIHLHYHGFRLLFKMFVTDGIERTQNLELKIWNQSSLSQAELLIYLYLPWIIRPSVKS